MFQLSGKVLDLLKNGVTLCSPYEFLFPTMGIGYQKNGDFEGYAAYHFSRLPNLDIHKGYVLLDENTVFVEVPNSMTVKTLKQMVLVDMYKEKIDVEDADAPFSSADIANNPVDSSLNVIDNPLAMVRHFDLLKDIVLGDDLVIKGIDQNAGFTPWFGDSILPEGGFRNSKSDVEKYNYGYIQNTIPFNFILGCGYRTLLLNMHLFKLAYKSDDGGISRIATNTLIPPEIGFSDDRLKKIMSSISSLSMNWKVSAWDGGTAKPQYYYVSTFDLTNKNSAINSSVLSTSQVEKLQSKGSLNLGNLFFSKRFHPYVDILTKAVYDTYVSFGCTHSVTDSLMRSANKVDALKMVIGNGYTNIRMYTYQMQNDRIRFPNESRLYINGAGESKNTVRPLYGIINNVQKQEALLNNYAYYNELSVASTIQNAIEQRDEGDDDDSSFFSAFQNTISTKNYPPMNYGLNERIGKYVRSPIFLDEILQEFNAAKKEDVEKIKNILKAYARTPGFVVVKTNDLFNQDAVDHCMGVDGIFGQESAFDDNTLSGYGDRPMPEYLALPFFFFQHLLKNNMFSTINIVFIANFIKGLKIPEKGSATSFKKAGFNIMADLVNFALTPYIALYERMYSVLFHDRIYKFIRNKAKESNAEVNMFMNHAAKEFILFTNKDTFSNLKMKLYVRLSLIEDKEYKGKTEFAPYILIPPYPVDEADVKKGFDLMADNSLDEEGNIKMETDGAKKNKSSFAARQIPNDATSIINRLEFMVDSALREWLKFNGGRVDYSEEKKIFAKNANLRRLETEMAPPSGKAQG